jgi:hypothetical protein
MLTLILTQADVFLPKSRRANPDLDACATQRSVFDDPIQAPHHLPPPEYENFKNFDVNLRWTWREEKAVVRIIDFRVLLVACIAFASLNLDRNNLSAANSAGILPDLGLTTNDFNLATTLFRISFLVSITANLRLCLSSSFLPSVRGAARPAPFEGHRPGPLHPSVSVPPTDRRSRSHELLSQRCRWAHGRSSRSSSSSSPAEPPS